jgi:hypothetical protein
MGPDDPTAVTPTPAPSAPVAKASDAGPGVGAGKTVVSTVWPNGDFVIEDLPTITREGTEVDNAQLDAVKEMAKLCDVRLHVRGGAE